MGNAPAGTKSRNARVSAGKNYAQSRDLGGGAVHMIITALDYKRTANPLTCTKDGGNMQKLAAACGVDDLRVMYDEQCTAENVKAMIQAVGSQCLPDDFFIFYYSGHGTSIKDLSGDEADGLDEAFCFVTPDGQITLQSCMKDDDFSRAVCDAVPDTAQVLVLTDCCHSGTICDLGGPQWAGRKAISIAGCLDNQTSGDMGRGGIFTHSLLMAIDKLLRAGERDASVGGVYNATLLEDERIFHSAQDITIQCTASVAPDGMRWPLTPLGPYQAPLSQASAAAGGMDLQQQAGLCDTLGVSPAVLQFVTTAAIEVLPEDYQAQIQPLVGPCFALLTLLVQRLCA